MLANQIVEKLINNKNILLLWKTNVGKSHFIIQELIPILKKRWIVFSYFEDCNKILNNKSNIYLIDEVELLFDKQFLEKNHPKEKPYYSNTYLKKVQKWHKKLSMLDSTVLIVVTRNMESEINNLMLKYKYLEWNNLDVEIIHLKKSVNKDTNNK